MQELATLDKLIRTWQKRHLHSLSITMQEVCPSKLGILCKNCHIQLTVITLPQVPYQYEIMTVI